MARVSEGLEVTLERRMLIRWSFWPLSSLASLELTEKEAGVANHCAVHRRRIQ